MFGKRASLVAFNHCFANFRTEKWIFAIAFWVLSVERVLLMGSGYSEETLPWVYTVRLLAFLLILGAIVDKNRKGPSQPRDDV